MSIGSASHHLIPGFMHSDKLSVVGRTLKNNVHSEKCADESFTEGPWYSGIPSVSAPDEFASLPAPNRALALRQSPDSVSHNEGGGFAVVPRHQVSLRHLTMPHFRAKRRIDNAVRTVWLRIAMPGIDLLDSRASSQRSGRLK
jgi:hypothetical protein